MTSDPPIPAEAIQAAEAVVQEIYGRPPDDPQNLRWCVQRILGAAAPHIRPAAFPRCPAPCDDDCEQPCHEVHLVPWKRGHNPETCVGTIVAAAVAAEREQLAALAEKAGAMYPDARIGTAWQPFADLIRKEATGG